MFVPPFEFCFGHAAWERDSLAHAANQQLLLMGERLAVGADLDL
jgi:hypothetical protein